MPTHPTTLVLGEDAFLRAFFSPPNGAVLSPDGATWTVLSKLAQPAQVELLDQSCSRAKNRIPSLLPWIQSDVTTWYAIAFEPIHVRILQQWLRAFVGRTFGSFSELPIVLGLTPPAEPLLRSLNPAAVFSITVTGSDRKAVSDQVARLFRLLSERPNLALASWDTSSSLLRSFFAALAANNPHLAAEVLSRLKSGAFLDAVNLYFLEIQLLAAREDWPAIANPDRLKDILLLRRPLRIDSLIATALYRTHIAGKETDPAALLEIFKAKLLPFAGAVFSRQFLGDSDDALRCYLLWRLCSAKDPESIASAASRLPSDDSLRQFAQKRLAGFGPKSTPTITIERARACCDAGDWQGVIETVAQLVPSSETLGLAIRAAAEIGTSAAAHFASNQWERHAQEHRDAIFRSRWLATLWKSLSVLCNEREPSFVPSDPGEWFSHLSSAPDWPQAQATWNRGIGEWDFKEFVTSTEQIALVTKVLTAPPSAARHTLRQILPQLLFRIPEEFRGSRSLQKVHLYAAEFLATTDGLSEEERELMLEASQRTLASGLAQEEYSYLIEQCFTDAWQRTSSPSTFPWAVSLLEVVVDHPASAPHVQSSFAQLIFADSQRYFARICPSQILLLRELLKIIGMDELASALPRTDASTGEPDEAQRLHTSGIRRLGIYTLMEAAAKRAQLILQAKHPTLEVLINTDHVATTSLRNMARECEALLVVTASAKHAATICIEQNRRGLPITYVNGKGSSSILSAWTNLLEAVPIQT